MTTMTTCSEFRSGQYRSFLLPVFLFFAILSPKCAHNKPPQLPSPTIGVEQTQALNMLTKQTDETADFVGHVKAKAGITQQQIEYASDKYGRILTKVNPLVDLIKQNTTSVPNLTESEFRDRAKAAVDTNVEFDTLMETAIYNTQNPNNFVLMNANTLPDAWTKIWKAVPALTPQQQQQLFTFLDSRIKYKAWDAIKKK
jgi:hypothetical protein